MLTELRIENFKAFGKEQTIPLRPITLLYGPNSAGKSSVLQSILLLKQTIESTQGDYNIVVLNPSGSFIDFGNYQQFINAHDINKTLKIGFKFEPKDISTDDADKSEEFNLETVPTGCDFIFKLTKDNKIELINYSIKVGEIETPLANYILASVDKDKKLSDCYKSSQIGSVIHDYDYIFRLYNINLQHPFFNIKWNKFKQTIKEVSRNAKKGGFKSSIYAVRYYQSVLKKNQIVKKVLKRLAKYSYSDFLHDYTLSANNIIIAPSNFLPKFDVYNVDMISQPLKDEIQIYSDYIGINPIGENEVDDIAVKIARQLASFLKEIKYLGPARNRPEQFYRNLNALPAQPNGVGKFGELVPSLLCNDKKIIRQINLWFNELNISYKLAIEELKSKRLNNIFMLILIDTKTGLEVNHTDVGFGISQLLPILVQGLVSKNTTIMIEQPEIHLHPRLQAEVGSFLADNINQGNQFIVETHSEHLLLRLQNLIRNKKLSHEDVSVVYIDKSKEGVNAKRLRLDEEGDFIDEWPGGFFSERLNELT